MTLTAPAAGSPGARASEIELFSVGGHDGCLQEVNEAFGRLLGLTQSAMTGRSLLELVHPDDLTQVVTALAGLEAGAAEVLMENRFRGQGGHGSVYLQWVARPVAGTDLWWGSGRDTTEFHRALARGTELAARLDLALSASPAAMWELDIVSGCLSWEAQAADVLGTAEGALPRDVAGLLELVDPGDTPVVLAAMERLRATGRVEVGVHRVAPGPDRHLSLRGKVLERDRRGRPLRAVGLVVDVTNDKAMEEQMLRMVMTDALTGVPNRRAFDQALRGETRRCGRSGQPLSVVMVDLDDFKRFNDSFGHSIGDDALCAVARALSSCLHREGDLLTRFGGEEFALVLPGSDRAGAFVVAERLLAAVRACAVRQAPGWTFSVSVGTATWHPAAGPVRPRELLSRADEALYAAKRLGKDRAVAYEQALAERDELEQAVAAGLVAGEFELYYQPVLDLATGLVSGFEALARWNRPGHGVVAPDAFIPVAETSRSSLICDLGRWALGEATRQLAAWGTEWVDPDGRLSVAVNVSGRHVVGPEIVTDVLAALAASGLRPDQLELEVTETAAVDQVLAGVHLATIRALGVSVALDDFGTGFTSIGQIPHLPVDTLKIDRSFIASRDPRQRELVTLMISAARAFTLRVVAEGVEDQETLSALDALGCDTIQGYHFARPMPAGSVQAWMRDQPVPRPAAPDADA